MILKNSKNALKLKIGSKIEFLDGIEIQIRSKNKKRELRKKVCIAITSYFNVS